MVATLVVAGWFDRLHDMARVSNPNANFNAIVLLWASTNVVLSGLVLLLAWFVILKNGKSTLVLLSFLIVGLLLLFSYILEPLSLLPPFLWQPFIALMPTSPRSLVYHASAFIALIGLLGLVVRRRP